MCKKLSIPVEEREYSLDELMNADEVIVSSSSNFCLKAGEVDGKAIGGKAPQLLKSLQDILMQEYLEAIGENKESL
jgi:D-alanine transaminase